MTSHSSRLVKPEDLPETLWNSDKGLLCLPPSLIKMWLDLLSQHDLLNLAKQKPPKNIAGGMGEEETNQHLAFRFAGSASRVELAVLDPKSKMPDVSDAFARVFSGGKVLVADVPCGSGAAILAILTSVAELRRQGRIPREPLHVVLVGGEISEFARAHADQAIKKLQDDLQEQAIWIEPELRHWDVCDPLNNSQLVKRLTLQAQDCRARMTVVANFSAFLHSSGKMKEAEPQLQELFRHSQDSSSSVIWIEPEMKNVTDGKKGLFSTVLGLIAGTWASFVKKGKQEGYGTADAQVRHPLFDGETFKVRLAVLQFDVPDDGSAQ